MLNPDGWMDGQVGVTEVGETSSLEYSIDQEHGRRPRPVSPTAGHSTHR